MILQHEAIDVVLLDMSLPDSSGQVTFLTVSKAAPQVPVVVLSGIGDVSLALEIVQNGAQDYLVKGHVDIRSDNGPEFVALAVQEWIARNGFRTLYIKPGAPWQNAYSERVPAPSGAALRAVFGRLSRSARINSRFRDEFLNREAFASVLEAKVLGKQHRQRHGQERPHSSLDYQTPVEFAQRSLAAASATLRQPQGCALPSEHQTNQTKPENNEKLS